MRQVTYTKSALKTLRRMLTNTAQLVMGKVDQYAADPAAHAKSVTALKGRAGIRLRAQNWRVIMLEGVVIEVLDIGPRGGIFD